MTLYYYDPLFLEHDTGTHPERAQRVAQVARHLDRTGLADRCMRPEWAPATDERIGRVHSTEYLCELDDYAARGGGRIEADTLVSPRSCEVVRYAAGAACDAVERVLRGEDRRAFCLVRPPGHHALAGAPMGFCLLNHIAIAARLAITEFQLDRVLIVDWDVHHGNGTQDVFWTDPQVGFLSLHRWPFYPGTGDAHETGGGAGHGTTRNVPLDATTPRPEYLKAFGAHLNDFAARMRPQLILLSAGFDAHAEDPVGGLNLEIEDFADLTRTLLDLAAHHCEGRVVSLLEGGYNPGILAGCVEEHLGELLKQDAADSAR